MSSAILEQFKEYLKKEKLKFTKEREIILNEVLEGEAEGWNGPIRISEVFVKEVKIPDSCR